LSRKQLIAITFRLGPFALFSAQMYSLTVDIQVLRSNPYAVT